MTPLSAVLSDPAAWLGLAGLVIALLTFIGTQIQQSRTLVKAASSEWVRTLEQEVALLRSKLEECEEDRGELHDETARLRTDAELAREREYRLMRKVEQLEEASR